jgi:hypothetical protein
MFRSIALFAACLVFWTGCLKPAKQAPTSQTSSAASASSGSPTGGAVQAVRGAVQRTLTANDLSNLRIFIDNASLASGQMPSRDEILAAAKQGDPKLHALLQDGLIVLTGTRTREGIWAYEKDAPSKGGMVLSSMGVERLTPQELNHRLSLQN